MILFIPLTLLLTTLIITSCSWDKEIIKPVIVYCQRPPRPVLIRLDESKSFCDPTNEKIMTKNLNSSTSYSLKLEEVVNCYEKNNQVTK